MPLKIAALYALMAGLWILWSDRILESAFQQAALLNRWQTLKGLAYVLVTTLLLAALVRCFLRRLVALNESLAQRAEHFRRVFENSPVPYQALDAGGRILEVNEAWLRWLGYARPEVLGQPFERFVVPADRPVHAEALARWRHGAAAVPTGDCELDVQCKDGRVVRAAVQGRATHDAGGTFERTHCALHDLTERTRHEREIERMNRLYAVLSQVNQAIVRSRSRQEVFDRVCRAALALGGFKLAWIGWWDAATQAIVPVAQAGDDQGMLKHFQILADLLPQGGGPTGTAVQEQRTFVCNDVANDPQFQPWRALAAQVGIRSVASFPVREGGAVHWALVLYAGEAGFFQEAEVRLLEEAAADVSFALEVLDKDAQRQQAEAALQENARLLQESQALARLGSYVTDLKTGRWSSSAVLDELFGITDPNFVRNTEAWSHVVHPDDREAMVTHVKTEVLMGRKPLNREHRILRLNDGAERWVHQRGELVYDAAGEPVKMIGTVQDITDRKRVEAQFLRAQRLESIGTLASGVAHDLNNILAPILMSLELLRPVARELEHQSLIEMMAGNCRRGAAIVKQLLTFGRGLNSERAVLQPRRLLREIAKIIQETFPKSLVLEQQVPNDLWHIEADPTQVHQVLLNLCVNARDAMSGAGTLTLAAENVCVEDAFARRYPDAQPGPHVVIRVSDTGAGIAPEIRDQIFDPFFTTKEPGQGTGLGLATVLGIVRSHGGVVDVHSQVGDGTQFATYWPALDAVAGSAPDPSSQLSPRAQGQCILVVEDEEPIRNVAQRLLESGGYHVRLAADGAEALRLYAHHHQGIQAVVVDMLMPVLDGAATIRELRKLNPHARILAMSGLAAQEEPARQAGGVDAFLLKPFTREQFLNSLNALVRATAA